MAHITHVSWHFTSTYEIGRQLMKAPSGSRYRSIVDLIYPTPPHP